MRSVRLGIVGIGGIGSAHFNCVGSGKIGGMNLAAVCDIDPTRLDYCKSIYPDIPTFLNWRDMTESGLIDALLIAVPHPLHAEIAIEAFEKGLHVLTEKPVGITVSAAKRVNETAISSGLVFGIMFNQRTNPLYKRAREIVCSGGIGELKRTSWIITNWYRTQSYYDSGGWRATWAGEGGGVLLNQAPHNLDLWQWICGMPSEVTAFCDVAKWHNIEVEDDVTVFVRYPGGATGTFITSTGEYPGTNRLEISGSLGSIVIEKGRLIYNKLNTDERQMCYSLKEPWPATDFKTEVYSPKDSGSAHMGILKNFADAILFGDELIAPGVEGINELAISNAAYLSDWTKSTVSLPFDEKLFDRLLCERQNASQSKTGGEKQIHYGYSPRWQVRF